MMCMVFQDRCPVFAKSAAQRQNVSQPAPNTVPYPTSSPAMPTPYPMNSGYSNNAPYPNAGSNQFPRYLTYEM